MHRKIWRLIFPLYCALMLWLLFDRSGFVEGIPYAQQLKLNLMPFHTISLFARLLGHPVFGRAALVNLAGNVVMFVPLGFLLPRVFPKINRLWKLVLTVTGIILLVELAQLVTVLGSCDIDDLLLNVPGAAIGYLLHKKLPDR